MKEFEVTITRTIREVCRVTIEAVDEGAAYELADERYIDGDYNDMFENDVDPRNDWGYDIEVSEA